MEFLNSSLAILLIQALLVPVQVWSYIIRSKDKTRLRFLLFNVGFVLFNLFLTLQNSKFVVNSEFQQELVVYLGIAQCTYLYFYISTELGVFKSKNAVKLFLGCLLFRFLFNHFETESISDEKEFLWYVLFASGLLVLLIWSSFALLIRRSLETEIKLIPFVICARIVLILSLTLPFTLIFIDSIEFQVIYLNLPFFIISFGYFWQFLELNRRENETRGKTDATNLIELKQRAEIPDIHNYGLKGALLEIALLLIEGYTQDEIAVHRRVTPSSTRNQCCKMYKIIGVKDLNEFRSKFNVPPRK